MSLCPHALFVLAVLLRLSRLSAHTQLRHLPQSSQAGCCGPGKVHWGFLTEPYEAGEFLWENVANCVGMVIEARQIIAFHRDL